MKLHELSLIKSEAGLRSVLRSLFFGAKGALLSTSANFENMERTVTNLHKAGYGDRAEAIQSGNRYQKLSEAAHAAALKAMSIHSYADAHGVVFEADFAPEVARGKDQKQLALAAEASGVDIELLKQKETENIKRKYDQQAKAQYFAEGLFWSADFNDQVEIKTETVLNALIRQRDYMLDWSVLDLGELTILKHDIAAMEAYLSIEVDKDERQTSSEIDEPMECTTMAQMNSAYQAAIDAQKPKEKRSNVRRVKKAA